MSVNVNEIIRKLNPAERKKVEDRAADIIAEEMSLRDLRKARKLTQARVAKTLGITQDSVSRLEKRSDLLISTLQRRSKQWAATFALSLNSLIARRSCYLSYPKTIRRANPLGNMRVLKFKIPLLSVLSRGRSCSRGSPWSPLTAASLRICR
jgi:transcriptional regulator with XRE-family HTH domain